MGNQTRCLMVLLIKYVSAVSAKAPYSGLFCLLNSGLLKAMASNLSHPRFGKFTKHTNVQFHWPSEETHVNHTCWYSVCTECRLPSWSTSRFPHRIASNLYPCLAAKVNNPPRARWICHLVLLPSRLSDMRFTTQQTSEFMSTLIW